MAFETTRQEITKQANDLLKLFRQTRNQKYKDEELRLRRIVGELESFVGGGGVNQIIAGTNITISPAGGTGNVTINATGGASTPTLAQVTTAGNTTTNTIDVGGILTDYVRLDTAATPTPVVGMMSWDSDRSTISVQLDSDVDAHLGQDNFWYVKNQSGATIPKGKAVMAVGTLGTSGRILIDEMVADGSVSAKYLIGITAEDIANGADGFVMNIGKIRQLNTSVWTAGSVLYCDPSTPGNLTSTKPSSPNLALPIAFVVHSAANGTIAVRIQTIDENASGGSTPTLDQVTSAGNSTTNAITVGAITGNDGSVAQFKFNSGASALTPTLVVANTNASGKFAALVAGTLGSAFVYDTSGYFAIVSQPKSDYISNNLGAGSSIERFRITGTGNVLINSATDAGYKLDVNGTARIQGSLTVDTNTLFVDSVNDRVGIGTVTPTTKLYVEGTNVTYIGVKSTTNSGASSYIAYNDLGNSYEFGMWGSTRAAYGVINSGNAYLYGSVDLAVVSLGNLKFSASNIATERMRIVSASGNVLINTTTDAGYKLDVNGTARIQGALRATLASATTANVIYYDTSTGLFTYGAAGGSTPTLDQVTTAGNTTTNAISLGGLTVATNLIYTDTINSRVGIGTLTPSYKLHVVGDMFFTGHALLNEVLPSRHTQTTGFKGYWPGANSSFMASTGTGYEGWTLNANLVRSSTGWVHQNTSRSAWHMFALHGSTSDQFGIERSSPTAGAATLSRLFSIFSTGNVLIGAGVDAGYKLDVNGNTFIRGNLHMSDAGNRYIYAINGNYINLYNGGTGGLDFYALNGTAESRFFGALRVTGNLVTQGSFSMNGNLDIGSSNYVGAVSNGIRLYRGFDASMQFYLGHPTIGDFLWDYPAGTTIMTLKRGGNLLIGTTTDTGYKLNVNGSFISNGDTLITTANGRVAGFTGLVAGQTVHLQYGGDSNHRLSTPYGSGVTFDAYHGVTIRTNGASTGKSLIVNQRNSAHYIQEWQENANTKAFIDATGNLFLSSLNTAGNGFVTATGGILNTTAYGYTGIITFPTNPPGQQNLDFQNGILVNVF